MVLVSRPLPPRVLIQQQTHTAKRKTTAMKTYWDLADSARANLTVEQLEHYCRIECMQEGVIVPPAPAIKHVPPMPELETRRVYKIRLPMRGYRNETPNVWFRTEEDAQAVAKLIAGCCESEYVDGHTIDHAGSFDGAFEVFSVDVPAREAVLQRKTEIVARAKIERENESALVAYAKANDAVEKVRGEIVKDWHRMQDRSAELGRIVNTFEDYRKVEGVTDALARTFLAKAFTDEDIAEAEGWFGRNDMLTGPAVAEGT